jgi:hypothetical protein
MRSKATRLAWTLALFAATPGVARADEYANDWTEKEPKPLPTLPIALELAARSGYGSDTWNFGIGGRAGVSVYGIYAGASIDYFFGGTKDTCGIEISHVHFLTYGGELGYGFKIGFLTIRPLLGLGLAQELFPAVENPGTSFGTFYFQPGGLVDVTVGHVFFGVHASELIPTATPFTYIGPTFLVNGQIGVTYDVPAPPGND